MRKELGGEGGGRWHGNLRKEGMDGAGLLAPDRESVSEGGGVCQEENARRLRIFHGNPRPPGQGVAGGGTG